MMLAFRKLSIFVHLLRGMFTVANRFPNATPQARTEMNRAWSVEMLRRCGMKIVVHNDQARLDSGALVVGNHVSWIDIFVVNAWRPTPFVSKAEVRQWPIVGWLAQRLDTIFLQREKRSDAKRIMHELSERLKRGELMCVFPEGTTSAGKDLLPFHSNLFQAAVSAGSFVQPICLMYDDGNGRQSESPAYIDDLTLAQTLNSMLHATPLTAHLYVCDAIAAGDDRRVLAKEAQAAIEGALRRMQAGLSVVTATHEEAAAESADLEGLTPGH
jgi:1-acyl-sn-glycerol-3-phosphate acyltransferase